MNAMFEELLLIDPDHEILEVFQKFLESHHYLVVTAASGADATRQLQLSRPDLIVIEPVLSDDWGERVLEQYQQTATGVPVIGLSKRGSCSVPFPFSDYHIKPISLFLLLDIIRVALQSGGLEI